jgi:signal transduction histidine kinase
MKTGAMVASPSPRSASPARRGVVVAPLLFATALGAAVIGCGGPGITRIVGAAMVAVVGAVTALWANGRLSAIGRAYEDAVCGVARAREDAERACQKRDELVRALGHDLRTPVSAILGWTTLLRRRPDDPETVRRATETIDRSARAQARLVEGLEEFSRTSGASWPRAAHRPPSPATEPSEAHEATRRSGKAIRQEVEPGSQDERGRPRRRFGT